MKKVFIFCLVVMFACPIAMAQQLVWQPINPSFGGNPYNASWLMQSATIQDPHGFLKAEPRATVQRDPMEIFQQRLTDRLFYKLSQQIVDAAFGEEELEAGEYTVDNYVVNIVTDGDGIKTTITDTVTGNTTTVEVPYY